MSVRYITLLLIVNFVCRAESIKCYVCNYEDENCPGKAYISNCDEAPIHKEDVKPNCCIRIITVLDGKVFDAYSCGTAKVLMRKCISAVKKTEDTRQVKCSACNTDLCNQSAKDNVSWFTITLILLCNMSL